jgi:hemerythrin-like domain-containing protein
MAVGAPPKPIESYAINGCFPDKEAQWKYPAISDGWFRIHNAIRAEMGKFRAILVRVSQQTEIEDWQINALKTYWKGHSELVHSHHAHEEELLIPMLKERVDLPDKLEKDHEQILKLMSLVDEEVAKISTGAGSKLAPVLQAFDKYDLDMKNHLTEEEDICVPLMRAYFEPEYIGPKIADIMKEMDKTEMGAFVHHQGSQAEFQKFMAQEDIPFFVWYLEFKACRTMYRKKMETLVQRVLTGAQPANTSKKELADAINFDPSMSWKVA